MQRRDAVLRALRDHPISQRRVCVLVGVDPKTVRRDRPPDNPEIRKEMNLIAEKRRRFGCRRIGVMLERKGSLRHHGSLSGCYTANRTCIDGACRTLDTSNAWTDTGAPVPR